MEVSEKNFEVSKIITSKDMSNPNVDHIGIMAYAACHQAKENESNPTPATPTFIPQPPVVPSYREPSPSPPPSPSVEEEEEEEPEPEPVFVPPPPPPVEVVANPAKVHVVPNWRMYGANTIKV